MKSCRGVVVPVRLTYVIMDHVDNSRSLCFGVTRLSDLGSYRVRSLTLLLRSSKPCQTVYRLNFFPHPYLNSGVPFHSTDSVSTLPWGPSLSVLPSFQGFLPETSHTTCCHPSRQPDVTSRSLSSELSITTSIRLGLISLEPCLRVWNRTTGALWRFVPPLYLYSFLHCFCYSKSLFVTSKERSQLNRVDTQENSLGLFGLRYRPLYSQVLI